MCRGDDVFCSCWKECSMYTSLFGQYYNLTLVFHCWSLGNLSTGMLTSQLLLCETLSLPLDIVTFALCIWVVLRWVHTLSTDELKFLSLYKDLHFLTSFSIDIKSIFLFLYFQPVTTQEASKAASFNFIEESLPQKETFSCPLEIPHLISLTYC